MTEPVQEPDMTAPDEPTTDEASMPAAEPQAEAARVAEAAAEVEAATDAPETPGAAEPAEGAEPVKPAKGAKAQKPDKAPAEDRKAAASAAPAEASVARPSKPVLEGPPPLRIRYQNEVVPALVKQFSYANPNQVPKIEKIVVNVGMGEALSNAKAIDAASGDLGLITGQKPIVMKARRSIAQFKIRTGNPIGLKVTLRGPRMWDFLERLLLLTLPRIRDFRGTPGRSFDGRGNYTLGMREQIAFPEIDYDKVDRLRGLEVSIVTTAKSDEESRRLLELLGMPFAS